MKTQTLTDTQKAQLLEQFKVIEDWKSIGPFCVDGRNGSVVFSGDESMEHLFVQALGGSLLISVIKYIDEGGDFSSLLNADIKSLQESGFGCGVHRGSHASQTTSDCGFADNLQKILVRLVSESEQIATLIDASAPGARDPSAWDSLINKVAIVAKVDLSEGETLIKSAEGQGSNLQTLEGDHAEIAAIVNLKHGTTFDTGSFVESGQQAFNLDLWYVLEQAKVLGIDAVFATHAALGLYVATEMVLVEDKKQIRLPIVINS